MGCKLQVQAGRCGCQAGGTAWGEWVCCRAGENTHLEACGVWDGERAAEHSVPSRTGLVGGTSILVPRVLRFARLFGCCINVAPLTALTLECADGLGELGLLL